MPSVSWMQLREDCWISELELRGQLLQFGRDAAIILKEAAGDVSDWCFLFSEGSTKKKV